MSLGDWGGGETWGLKLAQHALDLLTHFPTLSQALFTFNSSRTFMLQEDMHVLMTKTCLESAVTVAGLCITLWSPNKLPDSASRRVHWGRVNLVLALQRSVSCCLEYHMYLSQLL